MSRTSSSLPAAPPEVAGWLFPGGEFTLSPELDTAFRDAVQAGAGKAGQAHPALAFVIAQSAMGVSVAELLAVCDFDVNDGPMLVQLDLDFAEPLAVGVAYKVGGQIISLTRKPSRAFGFADSLVFELVLSTPEAGQVARVRNTWILPRRGLA